MLLLYLNFVFLLFSALVEEQNYEQNQRRHCGSDDKPQDVVLSEVAETDSLAHAINYHPEGPLELVYRMSKSVPSISLVHDVPWLAQL